MVLLWALPFLFMVAFYIYPLGSILTLSLSRGDGDILAILLEAIQTPTVQRVLVFTIWQAVLSTLLTLLIGLPGAYLLGQFQFPGKTFFRAITMVPFVMPTLVVAAGFDALLGARGWINQGLIALFGFSAPPIQFTQTLYAILLAHVFYNTTIVLRIVGDFWARLNPKFIQAAAVLGANRWQVLKEVTLPLLLPVIAAAALLVFIFDFTSFGVILVLGGPRFATLEVEIYYQTISLFNLPLAAVLSILQLGCTLTLTLLYTRLSAHLSKPFTQRAKAPNRKLVSWQNRLFAILIIGSLLLLLSSPLIALATQSFISLDSFRDVEEVSPLKLTLKYYRALGQNPQESLFYVAPATAIGISLGYAALTVLFSLIIGTPAAWALATDRDSHFSRFLDPLIMLPLGTSAVTLGLGFIIALSRPPLDLRTSPILIPIAHTLVAYPFVVRSLTPALRSIQPKLRHAAATLGASPQQVLRHIDLPLVGRALLVAAVFAFTISIGEFGASSLISRPEFPTLPLVIFRYLSRPGEMNYGQALALATLLMAVTIVGMLLIERFRIGDVSEI
jgi:thiamine transport system permease protein